MCVRRDARRAPSFAAELGRTYPLQSLPLQASMPRGLSWRFGMARALRSSIWAGWAVAAWEEGRGMSASMNMRVLHGGGIRCE